MEDSMKPLDLSYSKKARESPNFRLLIKRAYIGFPRSSTYA